MIIKAAHISGCTVCQAYICEHVYDEIQALRANLSRAIAAEKQNETLKMLLKRAQKHRDAACRALEKAKCGA